MGPSSSAKDSQTKYGAKGNSSTQNTWSWKLLLALIPIFFALYATTRPSKSLPTSYALCSNHAGGIYTVDGNNTRVECIVVDGPYIVNTGSLSELRHNCIVFKRSCSIKDIPRQKLSSLNGVLPSLRLWKSGQLSPEQLSSLGSAVNIVLPCQSSTTLTHLFRFTCTRFGIRRHSTATTRRRWDNSGYCLPRFLLCAATHNLCRCCRPCPKLHSLYPRTCQRHVETDHGRWMGSYIVAW